MVCWTEVEIIRLSIPEWYISVATAMDAGVKGTEVRGTLRTIMRRINT